MACSFYPLILSRACTGDCAAVCLAKIQSYRISETPYTSYPPVLPFDGASGEHPLAEISEPLSTSNYPESIQDRQYLTRGR